MTTEFTNKDDTIDSRDVIKRIEELEDIGADELRLAMYKEEREELVALRKLAHQAEGYGDWQHGAQLIHESYFTQHIQEIIDDCYSLPKEAQQDYTKVDFSGETYYIRS